MKHPFVLVHGAWHGGWCWRAVADRLHAAGHRVSCPTLTGVGERHHLASAAVDLATHIADVTGHLEAEELEDVILVGHSYGGTVITGVADRLPGRIAAMIYLDAFVPRDGQSMLDMMPPERGARIRTSAEQGGGMVASMSTEALGVEGDAAQWVARRITPQPFATFSQPIRLQGTLPASVPRTYIYCSGRPTGSFDQFSRALRDDPQWRYRELATGHDAMVSDPDGTATLLLDAASALEAR
jgi:pimeloyl-ACP methyl ester carboxylesterase